MRLMRKGQMTIFVIVALLVVVGVLTYFTLKGKLGIFNVSAELQPVFSYYEQCIQQEAKAAISLAGSQGGYTNVPEYKAGSEYAPFSSQLNFLGFPVPYWFYIAGNGLIKEQVPSKSDIEREIADYIRERIDDCDFDNFYAQGFSIELNNLDNIKVDIEDEKVNIEVISDLVVSKEEKSARKESYKININSKIGKFYNIARKIYEKEQEDRFFERYGVDVLRLYAPVDGVEISCSGKVWKTREVVTELKEGLETNFPAIKFKGNYYGLNDKKNEYYVVDLGEDVDENVNLVYSRDMPTKVEVVGEKVDESLMIASPIGIQEGLGVLGFCYAPYHFVYDVSFPILVQIYNREEMFQFPIVTVIDNNVAREAVFSELEGEASEFDLCEFMTQDVEFNLYDKNLNSVDGEISYLCFNQRCKLGDSVDGRFVGKAPSCLNGQLIVKGERFVEKKEVFSTNKDKIADVILDREYEVNIELRVDSKPLKKSDTAIVSFVERDGKKVASSALPEASSIKLIEGNYDISVYVYGSSNIVIPGSKKTQCQEVPRAGIFGFFGATKEQCFDIIIPETKIDYTLTGGGKGETYILDSQLENGKLIVDVDSLGVPKSLEELQYNYAAFNSNGVVIE